MTNFDSVLKEAAQTGSILLLLALALMIAACSDSDSDTEPTVQPTVTITPPQQQATPTPTQTAPTPTQAPANNSAPASEAMTGVYPLEVVDMLGRTVEIPAKPTRIVTISPTATEILYVAGGTAVARDSSSTFPEDVVDLPELGGAYSPSFESITAQGADLILIEALTQARFMQPLSQLGVPVVAVRATSLDDVIMGIKLIGQIIDNNEMAEQAAQDVSTRVTASVEGISAGKSVLILISDADRNLYAAKPQSYPGAIASMLQLSNPATDLPDSGTFPGFAGITAEQVLTMDPDYLFTITPAPEPAPRLSTMLPRIPGFSGLGAVTSGQMHEIDHIVFLRNPGPRIAEAVEVMAGFVGGSP